MHMIKMPIVLNGAGAAFVPLLAEWLEEHRERQFARQRRNSHMQNGLRKSRKSGPDSDD